jgi:hypothetical protein
MVYVTNNGTLDRVAVVCVDESNTGYYGANATDHYWVIGTTAGVTTSADMDLLTLGLQPGGPNYAFHTDIASSTYGNTDFVNFVPTNNYDPSGYCHQQVTGPFYSQWMPLVWNGNYLDLDGEEDADTIDNQFSYADTFIYGNVGADTLRNRATFASVYGGSGADAVCSFPVGTGESLYGEADGDCLRDYSTVAPYWTYLSCGAHTGLQLDTVRWSGTDPSSDLSCEVMNPSTTCGC